MLIIILLSYIFSDKNSTSIEWLKKYEVRCNFTPPMCIMVSARLYPLPSFPTKPTIVVSNPRVFNNVTRIAADRPTGFIKAK